MTTARADLRTSTDYAVTTDTTDAGGQQATSISYTNHGSVGGIAGISTVASPAETVKHGYIGQLYEVVVVDTTAPVITDEQLAAIVAERDAAIAQRDAAITERDARPTAEALRTVEAERDAIMSDIQLAYDEVNTATGGAVEDDLVAVAPPSSATIFDLVWTNSGVPADTIGMTIEFPEDTVANPVEFGFGSSIQGSVLTIDYQGTVTVISDPRIVFNSPVELDFSQELMGQNGFGATAGEVGSGDFNLFGVEVPEGTFNGQNYFTLGAPDGSEYILTGMLAPAPVTSRFSSLELNPLTELYSSLVATNEQITAARDAAIVERDARPTTEELTAVQAERDARPTTAAFVAVTTERDAAIAERNARPTSAQLTAAIAERDAAIAERDARPTSEQLAAVEAERDARPTTDQLAAVEAERDARPTAEQLAAVEAERDARYTEDQIRALSADYTIGLNDAGNVQMKFNLFESADLNTFAPLTLNPDSVSVVDGSICLEFAPEDRAAFFRFSVE